MILPNMIIRQATLLVVLYFVTKIIQLNTCVALGKQQNGQLYRSATCRHFRRSATGLRVCRSLCNSLLEGRGGERLCITKQLRIVATGLHLQSQDWARFHMWSGDVGTKEGSLLKIGVLSFCNHHHSVIWKVTVNTLQHNKRIGCWRTTQHANKFC